MVHGRGIVDTGQLRCMAKVNGVAQVDMTVEAVDDETVKCEVGDGTPPGAAVTGGNAIIDEVQVSIMRDGWVSLCWVPACWPLAVAPSARATVNGEEGVRG